MKFNGICYKESYQNHLGQQSHPLISNIFVEWYGLCSHCIIATLPSYLYISKAWLDMLSYNMINSFQEIA